MRNKIVLGDPAAPVAVFVPRGSEARGSGYGLIKTLPVVTGVDIIGAELTIDEMSPNVWYPYTVESGELIAGRDFDGILSSDGYLIASNRTYPDLRTDAPYGAPVYFYRNDSLAYKMFVKNIERIAPAGYRIDAMSAVGILDGLQHAGGLYRAAAFSTVLAEIIGGAVTYSVDAALSNLTVTGWLPYTSRRKNLHTLLFACGVMMAKDANGDPLFKYIDNTETKRIPDGRIYTGGSVKPNTPATSAEVTEHAFLETGTDETVTAFDNTDGSGTADHKRVLFQDAPLHSLTVTGSLTVHEAGVNYAVVSGAGILTGKKYTHITNIFTLAADDAAGRQERVARVSDCTLVNALNSENVAKRVLSYHSSGKTVKAAIVLDGEKCGDQIAGTDAFGDPLSGFLASMEANVSQVIRAECTVISNYVPTGGGNNFSRCDMITRSGDVWTAAQDGEILLVISGGGNGGYGGNGGDGGHVPSAGGAGKGGAAARGGDGGKILSVRLELRAGDILSFSLGKGGDGGKAGKGGYTAENPDKKGTPGEAGAPGTATTVRINGTPVYTSDDGASSVYGVQNILTGQTYSTPGESNAPGADGGDSGNAGESLFFGGDIWAGGAPYGSAGGGGAAFYARGGNARYESDLGIRGGAGANAGTNLSTRRYGQGGAGGCSGGGAGASYGSDTWNVLRASGGNGDGGQRGGNGFALIYS